MYNICDKYTYVCLTIVVQIFQFPCVDCQAGVPGSTPGGTLNGRMYGSIMSSRVKA